MENQICETEIIENFVKKSIKLDNESIDEKSIKFSNHLETAMFIETEAVKKKRLIHPIHIHNMLTKNIIKYSGIYRKFSILNYNNIIDDKFKLDYIIVNMTKFQDNLYVDLESLYMIYKLENKIDENSIDQFSWHYHNWISSIKPFYEENEKVSRLLLNNIRRIFNLDWIIIENNDYNDKIKKWMNNNKDLFITKFILN